MVCCCCKVKKGGRNINVTSNIVTSSASHQAPLIYAQQNEAIHHAQYSPTYNYPQLSSPGYRQQPYSTPPNYNNMPVSPYNYQQGGYNHPGQQDRNFDKPQAEDGLYFNATNKKE